MTISNIALFPTKHAFFGTIKFRHIVRFLIIYLAIVLIGLSFYFFADSTRLQIFGLGLIMPSGGFFAHTDISNISGLLHIAIALLGLLFFMLAAIVWFATGNVLAPPATWLLLSVIASSMDHGHVHSGALITVLSIVTAIATTSIGFAVFSKFHGTRKRVEANNWLQSNGLTYGNFSKNPGASSPSFTPDNLKRMRFLLDRALQPVHEFNGFEHIDQFQTSAIRYQINFIGYALSMAQATHLPAFSGYLKKAQRLLIDKQTNHNVWKYWQLENLWGNLRIDPNPITRDNIMFTGFCAAQMSMYHAAAGVNDFDKTGSFSLHSPSGKTYEYDLPSIMQAIENETNRAPFHLIACEPNWVYPLCNIISASAIKAQRPELWRKNEEIFRKNLENEFMDSYGRLIPCRSIYTGFSLPNIGGAMPQALPCFFLNATIPDLAMRQWLLLRREILQGQVLNRKKFWRIDTGNYRFSRASAYAATALAAAELGDEEIRDLCFNALDEECPVLTDAGYFFRPKASVWSHAVEFFARSAVKDGFRNLICNTHNTGQTPHISKASYPDVMVAAATYKDGMLSTILYPNEHLARQEIEIAGLIANTSYSCRGAEEENIISDNDGNALIHVLLDGRREIEIFRRE